MHNPIFDFVDEGMDFGAICEQMGFGFIVYHGPDWMDDEYELYHVDALKWLDGWEIELPEGYTLMYKYDTEDGPRALAVKPVTAWATVLLAFGFSEQAQKALEIDIHNTYVTMKERMNQAMAEHGKPPMYKVVEAKRKVAT